MEIKIDRKPWNPFQRRKNTLPQWRTTVFPLTRSINITDINRKFLRSFPLCSIYQFSFALVILPSYTYKTNQQLKTENIARLRNYTYHSPFAERGHFAIFTRLQSRAFFQKQIWKFRSLLIRLQCVVAGFWIF